MESVEVPLDPESERQLKTVWWVVFVFGVLTAGLGLIVIFRPIAGVFGLTILIAATLIVSGLGDILSAAQWRQPWIPVLWGIVVIGAGIATLVWPDITLWALAVVIGIVLVVRGALRTLASVVGRPPMWGVWLLVGLIELGVGIAAIVWPEITIVALAIVIGIDLLIAGIAAIVFALRTRQLLS